MNQQQQKQAVRLASALDCDAKTMRLAGQNDRIVEDMEKSAALLRSLAEEPQAEQEAWRYQVEQNGCLITKISLDPPKSFLPIRNVVALYTHPAAKQERLTEGDIRAIEDLTDEEVMARPRDPMDFGRSWDFAFARAIESACAKAWGVKL